MSSNATFNNLPTLNGTNWRLFSTQLKAYLMHTGTAYVLAVPKPTVRSQTRGTGPTAETVQVGAEEEREWLKDDQKALGSIQPRLSTDILSQIEAMTTAKEAWDYLQGEYGKPGIAAIYSEFKTAMALTIPTDTHPATRWISSRSTSTSSLLRTVRSPTTCVR